MSKYEIHISDVRQFKSCRRKWNWASPLRRNLEPNVPYPPFFTGRAIHYALEMYYGKDHLPMQDSVGRFIKNEVEEMEKTGRLWPQEQADLAGQIELIFGMMNHYEQWATTNVGPYDDTKLEFISLEKEFKVPLYNPTTGHKSSKVYLAGRFDGLVKRTSDNTYWVWECKTTRSITELERSLANDEQCGAYIYAARETFQVPVVGVIYNIMRKKVPTQPQVLKSGLLSQNAQIDTTAQAYMHAIKENHPDWRHELIQQYYGDFVRMLLEKGNTFFARAAVYRTKNEIDQLARDLWATALEMTRDSTPLYPTPSWLNCNFCAFRSPCLALNAGADFEFILQEEYRPRIMAVSWRFAEEKEGEN